MAKDFEAPTVQMLIKEYLYSI